MSYTPANPFDVLFSGANRSYNKVGAQNQSAFGYVYNPSYDNGAGVTGQWQPITTNNQGALRVDIGTGINISANITGVNVNIPASTAVTGVVNVTGQQLAVLTGQIAQLQVAVNALTGTITSTWQKTKSAGYSTVYSAITGVSLVNKIQGFSKTATQPSFIQVFDSATAPAPGASPDFVIATQPNNWFLNLAEAGVKFNNGLTIVNSSDAATYVPYGNADFIANVIYKS